MSFTGWDDMDKVKREACVKVEDFNLDCSQMLEFRTDSNRADPARVRIQYIQHQDWV
jgi:hypothetical protein